jgi:DNA-binding SARP family transcriptional activator
MRVRLLGPLRLSHVGVEMASAARRPRQVLALLLLNYAQVVPVATLMEELWDGPAPKTARTAVQTHVFELRKKLAEVTGLSVETVAGEILRTTRKGYTFVAEPVEFDLRAFRSLEHSGLAAMADGDLVTAARHFRAALAYWHGPALADVEPGPGIRAAVAGLHQSRATMLNHRVELELRAGRHQEILAELTDLVSQDMYNEDLQAQFIIALYRSGQRPRALEAFHRLRKEMVGGFGLEPSPRLRQYYQAVLASDPDLDAMPVLLLPGE